MSYRAVFNIAAGAAALNLAAAPAMATSTPVAMWPMDETFGTTMTDTTTNGNNGTTFDIVTSGGGYIFNGVSSKVVVPDSATLNPGTVNFSYSVQVQTDRIPPTGTDYDLMRKGVSTTPGGEYKLEIINSGGIAKAYCLVKDAAGHSAAIAGTTNLADGLVHTLTCSKTPTRLTLQVDALSPRKKYRTLGSFSNIEELVIGARTSTVTDPTGDWYSGTLRSASVSVG